MATNPHIPLLAAAALAAAAVAGPAPAAGATVKSCLRDGARLVAAQGSVRVVRISERRARNETRRERVYGCWTTTGRRFTIALERDFGLDLLHRTAIEIVDGRYVGATEDFEGGTSASARAAVWDARTARRLHDSAPCDVDRGDFTGVDDVAYLSRGGMAYACGRLRIADAAGDRELEPAGTDVRNLAVSRNARSFRDKLYWTVAIGPVLTAKSLEL
jgi:hypothetical protein